MILKLLALFLCLLQVKDTLSQICGCTDPLASNYDNRAKVNNGSCKYATSVVEPFRTQRLSDTLNGSSGLVFCDSLLLTLNDHSGPSIYSLDPLSGIIKRKYSISCSAVRDWEEISQDSLFIYIGDFGNNSNGNRQDLQILRIAKYTLNDSAIQPGYISFQYPDQSDFSPQGPNNTDFDCEAFVVCSDSIYLFTKQWKSNQTCVYALPKIPGDYTASRKGIIKVDGLITGVCLLEKKRLITMVGYSKYLKPFIFLLYDYRSNNFHISNKRKINIGNKMCQIEAIASNDGMHFYLTNEKFKVIKTHFPQLIEINLISYLENYLNRKE